MKRNTISVTAAVVLLTLFMSVFFVLTTAEAQLKLPSYAQSGNLQSDVESTGNAITKILGTITVIVGIIGIIFAAIQFSGGDGEKGKQTLKYAIVGLIIGACATGIAAIAIGVSK